jgi:hypothetical protein
MAGWMELTEFDRRRPIRPLFREKHQVSVAVRTLNADLTCRVCLGIIRNATTVMECMHRFCADCIEKSLRLGKKECPSCRTSVPSRRNLRTDNIFDSLVEKIYPDLNKWEEEQNKMLETLLKQRNHRAFAESVAQGAIKQQEHARKRSTSGLAGTKRPRSPSRSPCHSPARDHRASSPPIDIKKYKTTDVAAEVADRKPQHVCLTVLPIPWPHETSSSAPSALRNPYLCIPRSCSIDTLAKFIKIKLGLKPSPNVKVAIYIMCDPNSRDSGELQPIPSFLTVDEVEARLWQRNALLELRYCIIPEPSEPAAQVQYSI